MILDSGVDTEKWALCYVCCDDMVGTIHGLVQWCA